MRIADGADIVTLALAGIIVVTHKTTVNITAVKDLFADISFLSNLLTTAAVRSAGSRFYLNDMIYG